MLWFWTIWIYSKLPLENIRPVSIPWSYIRNYFLLLLVPSVLSCSKHVPLVSATPVKVTHRCTRDHLLVKGHWNSFPALVGLRFNLFLREMKREAEGKWKNGLTLNSKNLFSRSSPFSLKYLNLHRPFYTLVQG